MTKLRNTLLLSSWLLLSTSGYATVLSDVAESLDPGEWAELSTIGFDYATLKENNGHHMLQYSEEMMWDAVNRRFLYVGGGHGAAPEFLKYTESDNTWRKTALSGSPWSDRFSHSYDHMALDPSRKLMFTRQYSDGTVGQGDRLEIYDINANTWRRSAVFPSNTQCCGAIEYFPEMDRVIFVDGDYGIFAYNIDANSWSKLSNSVTMGSYENFAEYSPVHKVLVFGGGKTWNAGSESGHRELYRMNASGTITRLTDAPTQVGNLGMTYSIVTHDPVDGDFLVFTNTQKFFSFNPMTDTWTQQTGQTPPFFPMGEYPGVFGAIAAPIAAYGVLVVAKYNLDASRIFVYRHAPGGGSPLPPAVNFSVTPSTVVSGDSALLSWSASDADSCTAGGAWSGTKATAGTESTGALTSNATYNLLCTGPGGNTSRTVSVTVTTPSPTLTFTADPAEVVSGDSSDLSWTTTHITSCTASGDWSGSKASSGTYNTGAITSTQTYSLSCTGPYGGVSGSVTVSLEGSTPPVPALSFSATPSSVVSGATSSLSWSSSNTTSCTASGAWSGSKATSGGATTAAITSNQTYTLSCTGPGGTVERSVLVQLIVAPALSFSATPSSVVSGATSSLSWSSSNTNSCTASGAWSGSKATSGGATTAAITSNQTYTLSCTGPGGTVERSVLVQVQSDSSGGGGSGGSGGGGALVFSWCLLLLLGIRRCIA